MAVNIKNVSLLKDKNRTIYDGETPAYDMHSLRVTYGDGSVKRVRVFSEPGSLDVNNDAMMQGFVYGRLEDLMKTQKRKNYIFLGKPVRAGGRYSGVTDYENEYGEQADKYFNETVLELKSTIEEMEENEKGEELAEIESEINALLEIDEREHQKIELISSIIAQLNVLGESINVAFKEVHDFTNETSERRKKNKEKGIYPEPEQEQFDEANSTLDEIESELRRLL